MALPTTNALSIPLGEIQSMAGNAKAQAQAAKAALLAGPVNTQFAFNLIDRNINLQTYLNARASIPGLNAYATANIPGYVGTLTADIAAVNAASQACIDWVVTNFPKDSTNTFILAETLNVDGSRTLRTFTTAQTVGLRTALDGLIATIS